MANWRSSSFLPMRCSIHSAKLFGMAAEAGYWRLAMSRTVTHVSNPRVSSDTHVFEGSSVVSVTSVGSFPRNGTATCQDSYLGMIGCSGWMSNLDLLQSNPLSASLGRPPHPSGTAGWNWALDVFR
jgi:hypothetical protein